MFLLLAETKNQERLGFEGCKHYREGYLDIGKRKNRLGKVNHSFF